MKTASFCPESLVFAGLIAVLTVLGTAQPASAFEYVLREGDTLAKLAVRFYGSSSQWRRIADANEGASGFRVGQRIFIPEEGDPNHPAATIVEVHGGVTLLAPEGTTVEVSGDATPLHWQRTLRTEADALATVQLRSGATIRVEGGSRMTMLGELGGSEAMIARVRLEAGRMVFQGRTAEEELQVLTPSGVATLRGQEVRFSIVERGYRLVTLEGTARFGDSTFHESAHVDIPATGRRAQVHPLPGPVTLSAQGRALLKDSPTTVVAFGGEPLLLSWTEPARATGYELEVDRLFPDPATVTRTRPGREVQRWSMPLSSGGVYEVRLRGLDEDGRAGRWTRRRLAVVRASTSTPPQVQDGRATWPGLTEVSLERVEGLRLYIGQNEAPRFETLGPMLIAGAGEHELTVTARVDSERADARLRAQSFAGGRTVAIRQIANVAWNVMPPAMSPQRSAELVTVTVHLSAEGGRPFDGDEPLVNVGVSRCRAHATDVPGVYQCTLTAGREPGLSELPVVITGRGGSFTVVGALGTP